MKKIEYLIGHRFINLYSFDHYSLSHLRYLNSEMFNSIISNINTHEKY